MDQKSWLKLKLADAFRSRSRDEWCQILEGTDVCYVPALDWDEAPRHPHNRARETFSNLTALPTRCRHLGLAKPRLIHLRQLCSRRIRWRMFLHYGELRTT